MTTSRCVAVFCGLLLLGAAAAGAARSIPAERDSGAAQLSEPRAFAPPPQPLGGFGACCFGGLCEDSQEEKCEGLDGIYQGDGTSCQSQPCSVGACCDDTGSCIEVHEGNCFGYFHGFDTTCSEVSCGACCLDGDCDVVIEDNCIFVGGLFFPETACVPNPCPPPTGACCFANGSCTIVTSADCAGSSGAYEGDDTTCRPNPCPQPTGACCTANGSCTVVTSANCAGSGGAYEGDGTTCSPNPCPQPTGACCFANGSCTVVTSVDCAGSGGAFEGDDTTCSPNPCPQPTGACCFANGSCTIEASLDCAGASGAYEGDDTTCSPNPCPQPTGACCFANGSCTVVTSDDCAASSGAYEGDDTTCSPNPCPQPTGGCCFANGSCTVVTSLDCTGSGGAYEGDDTTCSPNPCPKPTGACCDEQGSCTEVPESQCFGLFHGAGTECAPNPCAQPGACCLLDGSCTFVLADSCAALDGNFRGIGLECDEVACPTPGAVLSEQKISESTGGFGGGPIQGGHFGAGLSEIGDVDGDGVTDLAVGEPQDNDAVDAGALWIVFLNTNGTVKDEQKISATQGGLIGPIAGDRFGSGAAATGDLDGDGIPDLAVGAPEDDDGGTNAGSVWVLFLNSDGTVKDEQKISAAQGGLVGSLDAGDQFGAELTGIGDLDQDGVNDLAVGAFGDDDGGANAGSVYILFLNANGTVKDEQKISELAGGFEGTLAMGDDFGLSVGAIDDLDGDGVTDLAVGAPGDGSGGIVANGVGAVWILFLNTDATVKSEMKIAESLAGFNAGLVLGDLFGRAVTSPGDLNGDALPDLVVGAPGKDDSGAVYVLLLRADGSVIDHLKVTEGAGGFGGTLGSDDDFGFSVARLGDLDGDGVADVAVAAPLDNDGSPDSGAVWVLFLDGSPDVTFTQIVEAPAAGIGNKEATGDLNGDGDPDVVIVIPSSNAIQVFLNNGTNPAGTWLGFTPQLPLISVGSNPSGVAIGFLDGGAHLDVAVSNAGSDTVSVLLGNGTGALALDTTIPVGNEPSAVAIADFANDSAAPFEIAVTNQADDTMVVLSNSTPLAPGVTTLWDLLETVGTGDAPVSLEPEDVDNDKDFDGVILNHGDETVTISLWQSASEQSQQSVAVGAGPIDLAAGDLDGDGLPEIVTANEEGGTITVLRNTTDGGGTSFAAAQPEIVGASPSSVTLADLDDDGDQDVAVTADDEIAGPAIVILENHSEPGDVVFSPPVAHAIGADPNFVVSADLDGDGVADLVTVNADQDQPNGGSVTGLISQTCPGDTDGGGAVGFGDLTQVLLHWGPCPEPPNVCPWDVNGDGTVGFADLTELLLGWGDCT